MTVFDSQEQLRSEREEDSRLNEMIKLIGLQRSTSRSSLYIPYAAESRSRYRVEPQGIA